MRNIILLLLIVFSICYGCSMVDDNRSCKILFFPTSTGRDNYLIDIDSTGVMAIYKGNRSQEMLPILFDGRKICYDSLQTKDTLEVERIILSNKDMRIIQTLIKSLLEEDEINEFEESWAWDTYGVIILVGNRQYAVIAPHMFGNAIRFLPNEVMRISQDSVFRGLFKYKDNLNFPSSKD